MNNIKGGQKFKTCDWCGEVYPIRHGCECKKLASNQEWLEKAGLVKMPVSCSECGGTGITSFDCIMLTRRDCPCIKDPNSLFNFMKKHNKGGTNGE